MAGLKHISGRGADIAYYYYYLFKNRRHHAIKMLMPNHYIFLMPVIACHLYQ